MQINSNIFSCITERISYILTIKQITKYKFLKDLGFSNGFLDKNRSIGTDKYAKILAYLPDINPDWLLTGEGSVYKEKNHINKNTDVVINEVKPCSNCFQLQQEIITLQKKIIELQNELLQKK